MAAIQKAFVPYQNAFQTKLCFSLAVPGICRHRRTLMVEGRSADSKQEASKREQGRENVGKGTRRKLYGGSIRDIATRIAEARDKFQQASDEVQALKSSPEGFVLGSDLSQFGIGSTSLVQDLEVPPAPKYWGLPPEEVLTLLRAYLCRQSIPEDKSSEYVEELRNILAALRGWTHGFADQARPLLEPPDSNKDDAQNLDYSESVDAFITLLQMSGFAVLPETPAITEPPSPEALPLGNSIEATLDPTLLRESAAVRKHITSNGVHIGSPSYYPHLFIATRGVSLVRKSGLLIPQKIRAIERSYFSWIRTPFGLLAEPVRALSTSTWNVLLNTVWKKPDLHDEKTDGDFEITSTSPPDSEDAVQDLPFRQWDGKRVRRVVPAVQFEGGLDALTRMILPTFTQEPAHEFMVLLYREVALDKESTRKEARAALMKQVKNSVAQAINPIPPKRRALQRTSSETEASVFDKFEKPLGAAKPVSLVMFADVQWGTMTHFFPSTFVLPATTDLLRVDALTFLGLVSTLVTYVKNADSVFIYASLVGSIVSYVLRVTFGWRTALTNYWGRIAKDRASAMLSRQRSTLDSLAAMSADELFPDVCCVWLSAVLKNGLEAQYLQEDAFGDMSLTDDTVKTWNEWLQSNAIKSI